MSVSTKHKNEFIEQNCPYKESAENWREFKDSLDDKKSEYPLWIQHLKIIKRLKEYRDQLQLIIKLNEKVDTNQLTPVALAAIQDVLNKVQKILGEEK